MATIGLILVMILLPILGMILNGWVLSVLWSWFLIPIGAPSINIPIAIGIAIITGVLGLTRSTPSRDTDEAWANIGGMFLGPLIALLVAWIVKLFM